MKRIIDLEKNGLESMMYPQHAFSLRYLWTKGSPGNSREICKGYAELHPNKTLSRASIIKCLNELVDEGLLSYEEQTCKGGTRRVYKTTMTPQEFTFKTLSEIQPFVKNLFEGSWWELKI